MKKVNFYTALHSANMISLNESHLTIKGNDDKELIKEIENWKNNFEKNWGRCIEDFLIQFCEWNNNFRFDYETKIIHIGIFEIDINFCSIGENSFFGEIDFIWLFESEKFVNFIEENKLHDFVGLKRRQQESFDILDPITLTFSDIKS